MSQQSAAAHAAVHAVDSGGEVRLDMPVANVRPMSLGLRDL